MESKLWKIIGSLALIVGALCVYKMRTSEKPTYTIGILQTASHSALDQAREGFIAELQQLSKEPIRFVIQNAEGSLSQAQSIAESFHVHQNIDAIFAIGTPAVQAAARVEKEKPIFIAAVSDPESLGVIHPGTNVCGTTDQTDTEAQAELILELMPAIQTVSIISNPAEHNSCIMVKKMEQSLQKRGVRAIHFGVHVENEIAQTIAAASRKGELILVPTDNLIVSAMSLVSKEAHKKNCPVVASDLESVEKGALIAQGVDYSDLGRQTALMAYRILFQGETVEAVGISHPTSSAIAINQEMLNALKMTIPEHLIAKEVRHAE